MLQEITARGRVKYQRWEVSACSTGRLDGGEYWLTLVASGSYHRDMRAVGLKILKNRLSEYVRLAASGETVLVTDRDRVVAELVPPQGGRFTPRTRSWPTRYAGGG